MVQVRSSKYRHVYGDPTRKEKCYDNIRLTKNAFDSNLVKTNGKYISLNWDASGGGSFAVIPVAEQGKLPDRFPLFDGHKGAVLDTDWNPFDDEMVVSASDDGTIGVWRVPKDFSVHEEYGSLDDCKDVAPVKFLEGHGKKVGHVGFNPVAQNVLASTSLDNTVKIWNVESGKVLFTLAHPVFVTSFSWNYDGTKLATVAKDKKIRVWDVREEKVLSEGKGHAGAKGSRILWLGDNDRVLTTGFSLFSDREMALWDANDISTGPIGGFRGLDPSSGIVIPYYDPMTSVVYLGGRGDGKIVYFEYADDTLYDLFAYNSTSPQRGLGWAPLRSLDPKEHEVARVYKVHDSMIEPIPFRVPLKNEGFLDNVYTYADAGEPSLTADEWKGGKTARPLVKEWKVLYEGKEAKATPAPATAPTNNPPAKKEVQPKRDSQKEASSGEKNKESSPAAAEKTATNGTAKAGDKAEAAKEVNSSSSKNRTDPKVKAGEPLKSFKDEEVAALEKAEKQDSYDVLQSDDVKSFLAKNSEHDEDEDEDATEGKEEESTWDDEAEPASIAAPKKGSKSDSENKAVREAASKKDQATTTSKDDSKVDSRDDKPKKEDGAKKEAADVKGSDEKSKSKDISTDTSKTTHKHDASLNKAGSKTSSDASSAPKDSQSDLDKAAAASSKAADAAQEASDAAKVSSESVSKAASRAATPPTSASDLGHAKLDEILSKLDAFHSKFDSLHKRLEALEKQAK